MTECRMEGQDGVGGIRTVDDREEQGWKTKMSSHRVLDRPGMKEDVESDGSDEENESGIGNQVDIPTGELQSEIQRCIYSEQQNRSTKSQISLVCQIVAQRTKVKSWENYMTKESILPFDMPS